MNRNKHIFSYLIILAFVFQHLISVSLYFSEVDTEINFKSNELCELLDEIDETDDVEDFMGEEFEDDKKFNKDLLTDESINTRKSLFRLKSFISYHKKVRIYSPPEVKV